jgi:hypothetical protein
MSSNQNEVSLTMPLLNQETYISHRAEAVANIQRTISELQGIFGQLAHLVTEQGETLERYLLKFYTTEKIF